MLLAITTQAATRTILARICRIDERDRDPALSSLTLNRGAHLSELPLRHPAPDPGSLPHCLRRLRNGQVLQDHDGVRGDPLNQRLRGRLAERRRPVALFAAKPFEGPPDTTRVLTLCLMGRKFYIQASSILPGLDVGDLDRLARDEQLISVRIDGHQRSRRPPGGNVGGNR